MLKSKRLIWVVSPTTSVACSTKDHVQFQSLIRWRKMLRESLIIWLRTFRIIWLTATTPYFDTKAISKSKKGNHKIKTMKTPISPRYFPQVGFCKDQSIPRLLLAHDKVKPDSVVRHQGSPWLAHGAGPRGIPGSEQQKDLHQDVGGDEV